MGYNGSGNVIRLISMRSSTEKHPKQLGYNPHTLVIALVTSSYSEGIQKPLKTSLINCSSVCNKCVVVGEVGIEAVSTHRKGGGVGILIRNSLFSGQII